MIKSIPDLREQIAINQGRINALQREQQKAKARIGEIVKDNQKLRRLIHDQTKDTNGVTISDHAFVRYIDRVHKRWNTHSLVDLILDDDICASIEKYGLEGRHESRKGFIAVIRNKVVNTVLIPPYQGPRGRNFEDIKEHLKKDK